MEKLVGGVHRFQDTYFAKHRKLFQKLATEGQRPNTLFITCSDSRVVPALITSSAPGELFIVRNIGNIVPPDDPGMWGGVSSAIEYAVEVLQVEDIIVCGHTQCGAITAILDPERMKNLPRVERWLRPTQKRLRAILEERYPEHAKEEELTLAIQENVLVQLEHLKTFPFVASKLEAGTLSLGGWVFDIGAGQIHAYDPAVEQFVTLERGSQRPSAIPAGR